ncbi:coatomer subunit beta [Reticulomyxa filosa]|uniref:Coatomer subunit beta n=1 Tax=Reticulomyxa filosa TaxID=46433 RepID=X6M017_RETFI|nr:coatomer subunit beta [Reticulomyxa filosa]|eukprot:ETO07513.1 coatomer subunit beta [Reticulomyxa filosa]
MDNDTKQRITFAIQSLLGKNSVSEQVQTAVFSKECRRSFGMMLQRRRSDEEKKREESHASEDSTSKVVQFDTMINLRPLKGLEFYEFDEDDALNVRKAVGNKQKEDNLRTRLGRIHQLTGFSDPVYAEACVTVHQFDIVLDFLIVNNTSKTLQNLALELHTSGDLKLVEKPAKVTLAANASIKIQASIKVSSTENGVIFGNIVYDTTGATTDKNIVVMNCIHMDIMDYVQPAPCSEQKFREMWVEFEWENKVPVNTDIRDLHEYLDHISKITNMLLLTPTDTFGKDCQYMAANLHAKSIFGEHALMNVSIEVKYDKEKANEGSRDEVEDHSDQDMEQPRQSDKPKEEEKKWGKIKRKVIGHIRIRCKSQGIALSLGEKITNKQKKAS